MGNETTTVRRFDGQVGIVTGGGSGIGQATAERLAQEGGRVVLIGRDPEKLETVRRRIEADGGEALAFPADVASKGAIGEAVAATLDRWGRIDVLVNNAGLSPRPPKTVIEIEEDDFRRVVDTNLWGVFNCIQAVAPTMLAAEYGRIVNVGSVAYRGEPRLSIYSATKAALSGLTGALAMELGPHGITLNVVAPGSTPTPLFESHSDYEDRVARMLPTIPVGRMGDVADQAAAILFFAAPEAGFLTSELLHVSGGRYRSNNPMGVD
jgi:NAD(P)-dependent dehydrogenase (short-subunit alcohol dehydrogenase family)